jgi:dTDP-4-dehydrorhamnose 3,5-epimerase
VLCYYQSLMLRPIEQIPGLRAFQARAFPDERGVLVQSFVRSDLKARGIPTDFRQAIQSRSRRGVVRGLHFQWNPPQGKLVRCVSGRIFDVVVDIRHGSPTLGDHASLELSEDNYNMVWVPEGFAHGFMALEEASVILYFCTAEWKSNGEGGILWNDPALQIEWPALRPLVSAKDRQNFTLAGWLADERSKAFTFKRPLSAT